MVVLYLWAD